jgi:hypothetical protein
VHSQTQDLAALIFVDAKSRQEKSSWRSRPLRAVCSRLLALDGGNFLSKAVIVRHRVPGLDRRSVLSWLAVTCGLNWEVGCHRS